MRGRIIHYNTNAGAGLIAAGGEQHSFSISAWQSDVAPALNTTVEFELTGSEVSSVQRVSDEVLMKEKASDLAGRLGTMGGAALKQAQQVAASKGGAGQGALAGASRIGKPVWILYAVFVLGAMFLPYITINPGFGPVHKISLDSLENLSQLLGVSAGGNGFLWLSILAVAVPVFWRHRLAWLALLLPLLAALKPVWGIFSAIGETTRQMHGALGADVSSALTKQMTDMLGVGMGAPVCVLAGAVLALIGTKRFLLGTKR